MSEAIDRPVLATFSLPNLLKTAPLVLIFLVITLGVGWFTVADLQTDDPSRYALSYILIVMPIMAVFLAGQVRRYLAALTGGGAALVVDNGHLVYRAGWGPPVALNTIKTVEAVSDRRGLGLRRYAKVTADKALFIDLGTLRETEADVIQALSRLIAA